MRRGDFVKNNNNRYSQWRAFLVPDKHGVRGLDVLNGSLAAELSEQLEPRLRRFGYSALEPGKKLYGAPGDSVRDVFAPWAV